MAPSPPSQLAFHNGFLPDPVYPDRQINWWFGYIKVLVWEASPRSWHWTDVKGRTEFRLSTKHVKNATWPERCSHQNEKTRKLENENSVLIHGCPIFWMGSQLLGIRPQIHHSVFHGLWIHVSNLYSHLKQDSTFSLGIALERPIPKSIGTLSCLAGPHEETSGQWWPGSRTLKGCVITQNELKSILQLLQA